MNCGCQVATAGTKGGVSLPIMATPNRTPLLMSATSQAASAVGAPLAPATAEGQGGALAQNLAQTTAPAPVKKKTSGWLVAALSAGALAFL